MTRINKFAMFAAMTLLFLGGVALNGIATAEIQTDDNRLIDVQSASGKITAVRGNTFSIEIEHVKPPGVGFR